MYSHKKTYGGQKLIPRCEELLNYYSQAQRDVDAFQRQGLCTLLHVTWYYFMLSPICA